MFLTGISSEQGDTKPCSERARVQQNLKVNEGEEEVRAEIRTSELLSIHRAPQTSNQTVKSSSTKFERYS